jgi:hypothetical protein
MARAPEDVVAMRAWQEHTLLAALPVGADAGVQLGQLQRDQCASVAEPWRCGAICGGWRIRD